MQTEKDEENMHIDVNLHRVASKNLFDSVDGKNGLIKSFSIDQQLLILIIFYNSNKSRSEYFPTNTFVDFFET